MIPGSHCEKKESKSFREGSEPRGTCNVCKAPEPKFVSKLADRQEPELTKDSQPKIPAIDEPGDYVVKVRYTVNTDGSVSDVEIVDSSGISAIDRAVRDSASKMRYKPAVQNGEPRSVRITRRYRISI
jgi:TonB family protein